MLFPLKNFSQTTSQPVSEETVRIPLVQANAIIKDLKLYQGLQKLRIIDTELITLLKERLELEKAVNASNKETIRLLKENIEFSKKDGKKGFAKFINDAGKILIGVVIGAVGTLVAIVAL